MYFNVHCWQCIFVILAVYFRDDALMIDGSNYFCLMIDGSNYFC